MEKRTKSYNEMYMYVNRGTTIYDLLGEYLNQDDFSASALLNTLRRDLNLQQNVANGESNVTFVGLVNTYNKDIHGRIVNSMMHNMTNEERDELLKKLQEVNPEQYNFPNLLQYINFLEDANFTSKAVKGNPEDDTSLTLDTDIEELNRILIDTAVDKADPELVARIRNVLIHMMLIPYVKKQILKENPERDEEKNPKLRKLEFFGRLFSNKDAIEEYDSAISYAREKEEEAIRITQLKTDCKLRRLAAISDLTGKSMMDLLEAQDKKGEFLIDLITNPQDIEKEKYTPKEGDYYWAFLQERRPQVVLDDEPVVFSKDGVENQTITLVSYGDFIYGKNMGASRFDEIPMKLIGVTVFGEDENSNYFLVTPAKNIGNLINGTNKEYYKKVLLSKTVLDDTVGHRDRFLPEISVDENGNASLEYQKEFSVLDLKPAEAVTYATTHPGSVGRSTPPCTLQELCNSDKLFELQMETIYNLRRKRLEKDSIGREEY